MGRKLLRKGGGTREGGKVRSVFQDTMITNGLWEKDGMEMGRMESVCVCVWKDTVMSHFVSHNLNIFLPR